MLGGNCAAAGVVVAAAILLRVDRVFVGSDPWAKPGSRVRGNVLVFCLAGLVSLAAAGGPTLLGAAAIAAQLSIMSCIVYRSSSSCLDSQLRSPLANVTRIVTGSLILCVLETAVVQPLRWTGSFKAAVAPVYICLSAWTVCALSDYCFHRFIWHAHWAKQPCGLFFQAVHNQYVQHYVGHHAHTLDVPARARMRALDPSPMSSAMKAEIERGMAADDVFALECSDHGFTVGTGRSLLHMWGCRWHTAMMYLAMPTGTAVLWNVMMGSFGAALLHACAVAYPLWLTVHHDKYHAAPAQRRAWAARRRSVLERWFWTACPGIDTVTREHQQHHHHRSGRERYFGLVPGGWFAIYPVWQTW
jgi:hypothetical protein